MDASTLSNPQAPIHQEARPPRFTGRLFFGILVIGVGVLFLLDAFGVPGVRDAWDMVQRYWPVIFVLIGITKFANAYSSRDRVNGLIWIGIGVLLTAGSLDWLDFSVWRLFWPIILILWGLNMVTRSFGGRLIGRVNPDSSSHFSAFALWSGVVRKIATPDFRGGDASATMGGLEIDLRQAGLASGPATIDLFVIMGGIEVHVPGDWTVRNDCIVIMGGFEDSRKETAGDPSKVLVLRGTVLMGGVEIKN